MTLLIPLGRRLLLATIGLALAALLLGVWWRFDTAVEKARMRVALGSLVIETRCGLIEYQEAGSGPSLLAVHGVCWQSGEAGHPGDRHVTLRLFAHTDACRCFR
jgi:hypothetical protein